MSDFEKKRTTGQGIKVDEDSVCRHFERIPESLIEEPEVCEWCEYFEGGFCFRAVED